MHFNGILNGGKRRERGKCRRGVRLSSGIQNHILWAKKQMMREKDTARGRKQEWKGEEKREGERRLIKSH